MSDPTLRTPTTTESTPDGPMMPQENHRIEDADPAHGHTGQRVLINTGAMAGSSVWRIGISFILQLFIARWLGLAALGQYTVALASLNVCQVLSELGLQTLLVRDLAQQPERRRGYLQTSLGLQVGASLLIWGVLIGIARMLPVTNETSVALWLVGASLPFYAITSAIQTIFQAGERMELVMGVEMFINTLIVAASLLLLWLGYGVRHLIAILIVTQAVSALLCWLLLNRTDLLATPQESVRSEWLSLPKRAAPFYALALADVLLHRFDILLLGAVAGEAITGIYSAAYNVVRVLMKVIQSYWKALYPTLARLLRQDQERYRQLCAFSQQYGFLVLLLGALVTSTIAEVLVSIYGAETANTVQVLRILLWLTPIFLLESYAILILMVEQKPLQCLSIIGVHLATILLFLPLLTAPFGAIGAAWAALIATILGAISGLILLKKLALPISFNRLLRLLGVTLVTLAATYWFKSLWSPSWIVDALLTIIIFVGGAWASGAVSNADIAAFRRTFAGKRTTSDISSS